MKKLTIKPFKKEPKLPTDFGESTWSKLKTAISCVYKKTPTRESKEELYRCVEDLCMHKLGNWLYKKLNTEVEGYIHAMVDSLVGKTSDQSYFLSIVDNVWKEHCEQMTTIRNVFLYLDRNFVSETTRGQSIWEIGMQYFRTRLESRADIQAALILGILSAIESDRMGQSIDEYAIKRLLRMLISLGLYHTKFEEPFLIDTERFFIKEGQVMIESCDPADFLIHTERRIAEAIDMTNKYLDASTKHSLLSRVESCLIVPHVNQIVDKGFIPLIDADRIADLRRMYVLFDRVGSADCVKIGWMDYMKKAGEDLMREKEKNLIDMLIELQERMENVLHKVFGTKPAFKTAIRTALEYVVNLDNSKFAELLARYLDKKLRGEKNSTENDSDKYLGPIMTFFRYMHAKDVFEAFYKKLLSKRLLASRAASNDLEKAMISMLKAECGANYTSKLEGMLQDILLSGEVRRNFKEFELCNKTNNGDDEEKSVGMEASSGEGQVAVNGSSVKKSSEIEFEVQVLTVGYWPIAVRAQSPIHLSDELKLIQKRFNSYYQSKNNGKKLAWAHGIEKCVVTAFLPKGKKELELGLYQTTVLMHFNKLHHYHHKSSFKELLMITGIEDADLRRTLQSLACGKLDTRILTKHPKGREVEDEDTFTVNMDFAHKLFRIKISSIQAKGEAEEDAEKTHEEVFRDRQYQVDAVIVRILKARKRISHTDLIGELLTQLKFVARPVDCKKRIESLIEREYLERDEDDSAFYKYIA